MLCSCQFIAIVTGTMASEAPPDPFEPPFKPPFWLRGAHAQTIYGSLWAPVYIPSWVRQRWSTPDQDFIHVDRLDQRAEAPVLVIFHGLEGSSASRYVRALANAAAALGWNVLAPNFRSCSGELNHRPRLYHAGDSSEIQWILRTVQREFPFSARFAVGVSLGANMLLKWLGEQAQQATVLLAGAVAVAPPIDLQQVALNLSRGFNQLYTQYFLFSLKRKAQQKALQYPGLLDLTPIMAARSMRDFDHHCIAPLHGFRDAEDYWFRSSSKPWLKSIALPTLVLMARDDPFLPSALHSLRGEGSSALLWEHPFCGGHVGFVSGSFPGKMHWMPRRVMRFLAATLRVA